MTAPPQDLLPKRLTAPAGADVVAGLTVALVAIPQSLAYAELAGLPAQYGLYASALPAMAAAAFVSSRYLQTGPVALTALLSFGALSSVAQPFSPDYIRLAALLALLVGLFRLALGLANLGRLSYLLSDPVLTGFTTGAAILIISSQVPKVLGVQAGGRGVLADAVSALGDPSGWQMAALLFAATTAAAVVGGRRLHPLFPGVLVSVAGAVIASRLLGYSGAIVGELDGGLLPPFTINFAWESVPQLLLPALAIALVGFAEPASIARTFAAAERLPWNANKEMFGQGVANIASALSGAFPVGGSFSRSSLSRLAGARSPWAGALTGLAVLIALPLAPLLEALPTAVLGAVIIVAVAGLIKFNQLLGYIYESRPQALVAFGTLLATLVFAPRVELGVMAGIALAIGVHLYRELATLTVHSEQLGETLRVSPQGVIWFGTVPEVDYQVRNQLAAHSGATSVELDLKGVGRLDYTGAAALARLGEELNEAGILVRLINVPPGAARAARVHLEPLIESTNQHS